MIDVFDNNLYACDKLMKMRVAIVLGNKLEDDCSPGYALIARLDKAYTMYQSKAIDKIICSWWYLFMLNIKPAKTEAEVMKSYLMDKWIARWDIITEDKSMDTVWNLYYCSLILDKISNISSIVIISSSFHLPRIKYLLLKIMPNYTCKLIWTGFKGKDNKVHEHKVLNIYKEIFKDSSNREDVFKILCEYVPWYSETPKRPRKDILSLTS